LKTEQAQFFLGLLGDMDGARGLITRRGDCSAQSASRLRAKVSRSISLHLKIEQMGLAKSFPASAGSEAVNGLKEARAVAKAGRKELSRWSRRVLRPHRSK